MRRTASCALSTRRHKWQSHRPKFQALELCHEAVTHRFRGHARLVRDEEDGSTAHGSVTLSGAAMWPAVFHLTACADKRRSRDRSCRARRSLESLRHSVRAAEECADVETVGGKNASLGEMIGALARLGVTVPGGFATTAQAYREFLAQDGLDERIRAELATLDVDDVTGSPPPARSIRQWMLATPFPPAFAAGGERGSCAQWARARRSPSRCAPRPPRRICRRPPSPASRRPSSTCAASSRCCTAMHEVFASLFNDRAISYRVHQGFDHSAVALSAGVQHMVRSDLGAERRHVHARHRLRLPRRGVHHRLLRTGRDGGAGRGQSGRVLRLQAGAARRQARRSCAATSAARRSRWCTPTAGSGERVRTVDVPQERTAALLPSTRPTSSPSRARRSSSRSTTAGRWTSNGARTARPARSTSCRRVPRPCRAAPAAPSSASRSRPARTVLVDRAQHRPAHRRGPARVIRDVEGDGARAGGRRAGRRHDRSGLGAGHEARRRHRHQPRRPHLPRGHHRARAGHSRGGRLRERHAAIREGQAVTVSCAEGDTGYVYDGLLEFDQRKQSSSTRCRRFR